MLVKVYHYEISLKKSESFILNVLLHLNIKPVLMHVLMRRKQHWRNSFSFVVWNWDLYPTSGVKEKYTSVSQVEMRDHSELANNLKRKVSNISPNILKLLLRVLRFLTKSMKINVKKGHPHSSFLYIYIVSNSS